MTPLRDMLDNLQLSRGFLLVLLAIFVIVLRTCQQLGSGEQEVARFHNALEERIARVGTSIDSLEIEDQRLLGCIRQSAMDRANIHPMNTGGIDDVRELEMLYCPNNDVRSIEGIGELSRLRFIDISRNSIHSLAPLADHPTLATLQVTGNPLDDISVIGSMPSLREVYLPNLPEQPCAELERLASGLKGNMKSIRCAGKRARDVATAQDTGAVSEWSKPAKSDDLTSAQQEELLEYERNQRYGNQ